MSNNGKGDKWRKTDFKKFFSSFDEIDWKPKKQKVVKPKLSQTEYPESERQ